MKWYSIQNKRRLYLVILAVIFVFYVFNTFTILILDQKGPWADDVNHLRFAHIQYMRLMEGNLFDFFFRPPTFYPPFTYYVAVVFFALFGASFKTAVLSQSFFQFILIFSIFYLGENVFDGDTGFLGALVVISIPFLGKYSSFFFLDIPAAAMVALSTLCLVRSEKFGNRFWTFSFFICAALGMLTRTQYVLYMAVPFLWAFLPFLKELYRDENMGQKIRDTLALLVSPLASILSFLLLIFLINKFNLVERAAIRLSGIVWIPELRGDFAAKVFLCFFVSLLPLLISLVAISFSRRLKAPLKYFLEGSLVFMIIIWYFYPMHADKICHSLSMWKSGGADVGSFREFVAQVMLSMGIIITFLAPVGVIFYIFSGDKSRDRSMIAAGFPLGLLIMYFFPVKDPRYFLPLAVFGAVMSVMWISRIKFRFVRWTAWTAVIYFCLLGWVGWILKDTPLVYPMNRLDSCFSTRIQFGAWEVRPITWGYGVDDLCDMAEKLGENRKYLLVWISKGEMESGGNGLINTSLHYRHNRPLDFTQTPGEIRGGEFGKLEKLIRKELGIDLAPYFHAFHYIPPAQKPLDEYDYIIIIFTSDGDEVRSVEGRLKNNTGMIRHDIAMVTGPGPGMEKKDIISIIVRIPMKRK